MIEAPEELGSSLICRIAKDADYHPGQDYLLIRSEKQWKGILLEEQTLGKRDFQIVANNEIHLGHIPPMEVSCWTY